jgi:hypothetical protein
MNEVLIQSPHGDLLKFSGRVPEDRSVLIESFSVSLQLGDLRAAVDVFAGYTSGHPAPLFQEMAKRWTGWSDSLSWEGVEGQLSIRATHDGHGQVNLRIELCPDTGNPRWRTQAEFQIEPGQLNQIANQLVGFFGAPR